jgi:hypothetical protein
MRTNCARRGTALGFAAFILILLGGSAAWAFTPTAQITSVSPGSGLPGSTVTVSVASSTPTFPSRSAGTAPAVR